MALTGAYSCLRNCRNMLRPLASVVSFTPSGFQNFHTGPPLLKKNGKMMPLEPSEPERWPKYNNIIYPPQKPGEPPRPAEVTHFRANVKYSTKKLWYIAAMIRGMSVDEAIKQLQFIERKGSVIVRETIEEAIEMAVRDHNVEFRSNLWIADSQVGKALTIKGIRKHARMRTGTIHYRYSHYLVRLREGRPPKHYYPPLPDGHQKLADYVKVLRERYVNKAL